MGDVELNLPFALRLNYPEIPESWFGGKFAFLVYVANMLADGANVFLEQFSHLLLGQPDRFTLKLYLQPCFAVLGLVEKNLATRRGVRCRSWCACHGGFDVSLHAVTLPGSCFILQ